MFETFYGGALAGATPALQVAPLVNTAVMGDGSIGRLWRTDLGGQAAGGVAVGLFNGTSWDPERANLIETLLVAATRASTTDSATFINRNAGLAFLLLRIISSPGGAQTLQLQLRSQDSSVSFAVATGAAFAYTAAGQIGALLVGPAVTAGWAGAAQSDQVATVLPRSYSARVIHSAAGNWQYELLGGLIRY